MSLKHNLRITIALGATALTMAFAPAAQAADPDVCNEAGVAHHTGVYQATDGDPVPPARFQDHLAKLGSNQGLTRAASESPALSECFKPQIDVT